jgi:hypothetical protein
MKKLLTLVLSIFLMHTVQANMILTGIVDAPLPGGTKGLELYVYADIADLSIYGVGFANNGGPTEGQEYTLPAESAVAGTFIYLANDSTRFHDYFGFAATYVDNQIGGFNGDDVVEIYENGVIIDIFGNIGEDGTGTAWEHLDSWVYRNDSTGSDDTTFVIENWLIQAPNLLDGTLTNSAANAPFPFGTYVYNGVVSTVPSNIMVEMVTASNAFFTWDGVTDATFYQVKYRLKGTTAWSTAGSAIAQRNVTNLTTKKYYQYKIRAQFADLSFSDFSDIGLFYTSACDAPTGVASVYLDNTRMRVRWDNNPDEIKGKIRYRAVGTTSWITQNSQNGNNFLFVNSLPADALIQYKVRSNCDGNDWSEYSPLYTHDLAASARLTQNTGVTGNAVKLYPNPTKDVLNMEFTTKDAEQVNITISNNLGETIHTLNNTYSEGIQRESMEMSGFTNGYYFMTIRNGEEVTTQKFMKMN